MCRSVMSMRSKPRSLRSRRRACLASALALLGVVALPSPSVALAPDEVLIVVNERSPLSLRIGEYYRRARNVPVGPGRPHPDRAPGGDRPGDVPPRHRAAARGIPGPPPPRRPRGRDRPDQGRAAEDPRHGRPDRDPGLRRLGAGAPVPDAWPRAPRRPRGASRTPTSVRRRRRRSAARSSTSTW